MSQAEQSAAARLMAVEVRLHCAEKLLEQHLDLLTRLTHMVDRVIPEGPCGQKLGTGNLQLGRNRGKLRNPKRLKIVKGGVS